MPLILETEIALLGLFDELVDIDDCHYRALFSSRSLSFTRRKGM